MNPWTPERVETLKRLWAEGLSGQAIADEFGCSRSKIMGKITRLRLFGTPRAPKPKRKTPEPTVGHRSDETTDLAIPAEQRKSILELTNCTCRFPIGEGAAMFFCGDPSADQSGGRPYCRPHALRTRTRAIQHTLEERERRKIQTRRNYAKAYA